MIIRELSQEPLPLNCIDQSPGSTTTGIRCEGCPRLNAGVGCIALEAGEQIVLQRLEVARLTEQDERRERENAILLDRLFNLQMDTLVDTAFTPSGMKDHLQNNEEIQEELEELGWGVIRLDGRFVNYMNRFGTETGDDFLQSGGEEITAISDGLVRVKDRHAQDLPIAEQRRRGHSLTLDIICRQGGDEFALLVRKVTPAQLALIAARVQNQLTVTSALGRYDSGKVPFIASVGFAHATDLTPEVTGLLNRNDYWQAFRRVSGFADEGQRVTKARQYDEMWDIASRSMPVNERPVTVTRPGDREVAELFLRTMCPEFMRNPKGYLIRQNQPPQAEE